MILHPQPPCFLLREDSVCPYPIALFKGLAVGLDPEGYGNPDFCWISIHEPLIWSFAGPIVLVIVVSVWLLVLPVCFSLGREGGGLEQG